MPIRKVLMGLEQSYRINEDDQCACKQYFLVFNQLKTYANFSMYPNLGTNIQDEIVHLSKSLKVYCQDRTCLS